MYKIWQGINIFCIYTNTVSFGSGRCFKGNLFESKCTDFNFSQKISGKGEHQTSHVNATTTCTTTCTNMSVLK